VASLSEYAQSDDVTEVAADTHEVMTCTHHRSKYGWTVAGDTTPTRLLYQQHRDHTEQEQRHPQQQQQQQQQQPAAAAAAAAAAVSCDDDAADEELRRRTRSLVRLYTSHTVTYAQFTSAARHD